MGDVFGED
jgi:hypothetical protein